jgi:hypothetical protein
MSCETELVGKPAIAATVSRSLASLVLRVPSYRFHYAQPVPAQSDKTNYDLSARFDMANVVSAAKTESTRRRRGTILLANRSFYVVNVRALIH